jgi:hypothetical protein
MCRIDDAEGSWDVSSSTTHVARKEHRCDECSRTISPGERYRATFYVFDGSADTHKLCRHCQIAADWLTHNCNGYLLGEIGEDIAEHAREYPGLKTTLLEMAKGMARKWANDDGSLMEPLSLPPPLNVEQHA